MKRSRRYGCFAAEVVGVEGSKRRVSVCAENAKRLGAVNVQCVFVTPGTSLPFDDESFDGVMAASSVEQTATSSKNTGSEG